jgi:hypothetical protein
MNQLIANQNELKIIFKQALKELIIEDKEIFADLLAEVIEDMGLINAIKEGDDNQLVSRNEIFSILNNNEG